jgi:tetratricopeptide (TPR) repeat protein
MSTPRCSSRLAPPRLAPLALCLGLLFFSGRLAAAAESSPSDEPPESKEAYEHYLRAYKLASNSAYEEALRELQQALEKGGPKEVPRRYPDYLFATAKIYQRLNRHIEAVAYYERYLKLATPTDGNRSKAESELERVSRALPTEQQFVELTRSYLETLLKTKDLVEEDLVYREVVLNLRAGNDIVSVIKLNPPYNLMVDLEKVPSGRGDRT